MLKLIDNLDFNMKTIVYVTSRKKTSCKDRIKRMYYIVLIMERVDV